MSKQEAPINNTPFSEEELDHFKERLNEEKKEAENKIKTFQEHVEELEEQLNDTTSSAAHHHGNIASSEEEREKYYTMIEREKEKMEDIKVALDKIATGNYGICNVTGNPIAKERLEVIPYAKYSKEAKESQSENVQRGKMKVKEEPPGNIDS